MHIIFVLVSWLAHVLCFVMFFHVPVPCFFCVYVCVFMGKHQARRNSRAEASHTCGQSAAADYSRVAHPLTVWLSFIRRWIVEWHSTALTLRWTCLLLVSLSTPNWSSRFFFIGIWKGVCHGSGAVGNYQVLEFHDQTSTVQELGVPQRKLHLWKPLTLLFSISL